MGTEKLKDYLIKMLDFMIEEEKQNCRDTNGHTQSLAIGAREAYLAVRQWIDNYKEA